MTFREGRTPSGGFERAYSPPVNQEAFKAQLTEDYGRQFPEHQGLLIGALAVLDNSLWHQGTTSGSFNQRTIYVAPPALEEGRPTYGTVVGELTPESHALLEVLYRLTGAHVMRDDRAEGESHGMVIRAGLYKKRGIYFREAYFEQGHDPDFFQGREQLRVSRIGEGLARQLWDGLTDSQKAEFRATSGEKWDRAIREYDVTRKNYLLIAEALAAARRKPAE